MNGRRAGPHTSGVAGRDQAVSRGTVFVLARGGLRRMKDTGEGFLGYTPGDLFWMDVLEIVHPDDLPRLRALLSEVKESPGTSLSVEVRFRDVSGRWHQMDASVQNVLEAPGDAGLVAVDVREAHTG